MQTQRNGRQNGSALLYGAVGLLAMAAVAVLAVDWGRVQVAKSELQDAADAAARYGAAGLQNALFGQSAAKNNAAAVIAQNKVDGRAIAFNPDRDVELGIWNPSNKSFTPTADVSKANAVRVTLQCTTDRDAGVPLTFMSLLGKSHANVTATSVATIDFSAIHGGAGNGRFDYYIPATSNPWLAGMPAGTIANPNNPHNNPDYAGAPFVDPGTSKTKSNNGNAYAYGKDDENNDEKKEKDKGAQGQGSSTAANSNESNWSTWGDYAAKKSSPITAGGISVNAGSTITFDGVNGGANNSNSKSFYDADGHPTSSTGNRNGPENGIGDIRAPYNSTIAVFLNDSVPTSQGDVPGYLDFSTAAKRDFKSLSPKLRQPFFIGDGRTSSGEVQQFVVPDGATRLFIGTMDSYEWSNNVGGFNLTAHTAGKIVTVR